MQESCGKLYVLWKDKRLVLLISTHGLSISNFPYIPFLIFLGENRAVCNEILLLPMHFEYITHMRSVDLADQLQVSYCT